MKDPRFNFYPDNYEGGTKKFTLEQDGAYLRLLMLQFRDGPFTREEAIDELMQRTRGNAMASAKLWEFLMPKFMPEDFAEGKFFNSRLFHEMEKAEKTSTKQANNAITGWETRRSKKQKKESGNAMAYAFNTGSGNDYNIDTNKKEKGGTGEKTKSEDQLIGDAQAYTDLIDSVTLHLNSVTGRGHNPAEYINRFWVKKRMDEGHSAETLKAIIDMKYKAWEDNPRIAINISPDVLFGEKFDTYLQQLNHPIKANRNVTNTTRTPSGTIFDPV